LPWRDDGNGLKNEATEPSQSVALLSYWVVRGRQRCPHAETEGGCIRGAALGEPSHMWLRPNRGVNGLVARLAAAVLVVLAAVALVPAYAQIDGEWSVKGRLLGKGGKRSVDISGIACSSAQGFPRSCLVIDDNRQAAQFVTIEDGQLRAANSIRLIEDALDGRALELDGEGVAFADGFYYVIGSHGHPRDRNRRLDPQRDAALINARIAAASQIVRLRADGDDAEAIVERTSRLRSIIAAQPALAPFMDRRLENNGLTIEGIAVRDGSLIAGFRAPVLEDGRAAVLSVSLSALFDSGEPDARLYRLRLGDGQGVRDLAAYERGVLILAGPSADGAGPYAVFWWDGKSEQVRFLKSLSDLTANDPDRKPEAILPLDRSPSGLRVLVLFDGAREGGPIAVEMPEP
jgi:hypothetical protein